VKIDNHFFPEISAGGFTRYSGTIEFYVRVNALLRPDMTVVDLGAGRGLVADLPSEHMIRRVSVIQGKVRHVIGLDIDDGVLSNPIVDEAKVYDGLKIPLETDSADIVVSDYVLEHVSNPEMFAAEVSRIIKPGGWFCARTPHIYSLLALAGTLTPNSRHAKVVRRAQPDGGRHDTDVFPTCYKLNSRSTLDRYFPPATWENYSYTWSPEPGYHFGNKMLYRLLMIYQYLKKPILGGEVMLVFLRKRDQAEH
jgi:SAM-dependent methyltransferase